MGSISYTRRFEILMRAPRPSHPFLGTRKNHRNVKSTSWHWAHLVPNAYKNGLYFRRYAEGKCLREKCAHTWLAEGSIHHPHPTDLFGNPENVVWQHEKECFDMFLNTWCALPTLAVERFRRGTYNFTECKADESWSASTNTHNYTTCVLASGSCTDQHFTGTIHALECRPTKTRR